MPDMIYYAIPVFAAFMLLEAAVAALRRKQTYEARDTAASLAMGVGNMAVAAAWKSVAFGFYLFLYEHRVFELGAAPAALAIAVLADDFVYYWFHRGSHEIRLFWAAHENHHSSQHYNYSTALRQSWTTPLTSLCFYWPLPLLGIHPVLMATAAALSLLYQFWIHTETIGRLGPLEWVFNTPSHHRVHHGANVEYLDRNYGGILILWDRLFGSFEPERAPVSYGLTKNIETYNPLKIAFHEWVAMTRDAFQAKSWRARLGHLFQPPGWSPDGSSLTARQMRGQGQAPALSRAA